MKNPGDVGWTNFYFAKNLQGDVVAVYRSDYNYSTSTYYGTLVAKYTYDPYGQVLTMVNGEGTDVSGNANSYARINPFRYRGYYQDNESGFYYLQSRYYDPEICRFINADSYTSTGDDILGWNMFVYCNNNPVMYLDSAGTKIIKFFKSGQQTIYFANGVDLDVNVDFGAGIGDGSKFSMVINTDDPENMTVSYSTPTGKTTTMSLSCNFSIGAANNVNISWGDSTYRLFVKGDDGLAVGATFNVDLDGYNVSISIAAKVNKLRAAISYAIKNHLSRMAGSAGTCCTGTQYGYGSIGGGGSLTPGYGTTIGGGPFVWTQQLR